MSIKYRGVPFASPSQTADASAFMHEELMEPLIHYDTALPSSQKGNPLLTLTFSKKEQK